MTRPQKILAFLDLLGNWDPSLLVVMIGAIGVYFPLQKCILGSFPKGENTFLLPKGEISYRLFIGSAIFGIGWGIVGFCPGPSITSLASAHPKVILFFFGLILGMLSYVYIPKNSKESDL